MTAAALPVPHRQTSLAGRLSTFLYIRPNLLLVLFLLPPMLWLGVVYLGSLLSLLLQSFFYVDDFTSEIQYEFGLQTYARLLSDTSREVITRTATMALVVTIVSAVIAFPLAYHMARFASKRMKAVFYVAVTVPLWSNYLVRAYSWKMLLAKEGVISWVFDQLGLRPVLDWVLTAPSIGGPSLSTSYIGTAIVFVYIWLPYMILPIQAALERVPKSLLEASSDLGAKPGQTFRKVILPLAIPGVAAGSIFTFSLTLGDYIIPDLVGNSRPFIGQLVYTYQGVAGDVPLAAAFTMVPIVIMGVYLAIARRLGAFDAL